MQIQLLSLLFLLLFSTVHADPVYNKDQLIHPLASLVCYAEGLEERQEDSFSNNLNFSNEELTSLWERAYIYSQDSDVIQEAYQTFLDIQTSPADEAKEGVAQLKSTLHELWQEAIKAEEEPVFPLNNLSTSTSKDDPNFDSNRYIPAVVKNKMRPYLMPLTHPMRQTLDTIFTKARVTTNEESFLRAGFKIIAKGPRSHVVVARHPKLPNYLVKAYFDNNLAKKYHRPSWEWLVHRCHGADKVYDIIHSRKLKHFVVAEKWIYCLPPKPSPPENEKHTRHLAILLVTDMELVKETANYSAWRQKITKEHLDELYLIISRAKGSSYRPDNIAYTKNGKFAFIDTEYPSKGPDFSSIRGHLNSDMRRYWDSLVRKGGKL